MGRVGNNYWMDPRFFFATSGPTKRRKHYLCLLFSQYRAGVQQKINDLLTSPSNQFQDYFIWNRIEKLVPLNWNFAPQTLKTLKRTYQSVFKLDFLVTSGFPKTRDLSPAAPRGVYISRNDTNKKSQKTGKWQQLLKSAFVVEMAAFFMPFSCFVLGPIFFLGPMGPGTWNNRVLHKNLFFGNSGWNWGSLGVSRGSIRRHSVEL